MNTQEAAGEFSVEIDPFRLDEEWVKQPRFYHEWAVRLSAMRRLRDQAKAGLDVVRAEVWAQVAADPAAAGLVKTTDTALGNAVVADKRVQAARKALIDAEHEVDVLEAAVAAIDQRKRALESLVQLHLSDYYATPRVKTATREAVDEMEAHLMGLRAQKTLPTKADD